MRDSAVAWVELLGGATIVREQKEDQGPCCEQFNFRIIGGPAPPLPMGLLSKNGICKGIV